MSDLPAALPEADIVIVLVPVTPQTTGLVDALFLRQLPDGALLVNAARGPVVDTAALLAELRSGRLRAALDVTDPEPLPDGHPLWDFERCIITPHTADTMEMIVPLLAHRIRDNVARFAAGEPLVGQVDTALGY
jgi:phosphoglycerate dehydrogenase-like enzyme